MKNVFKKIFSIRFSNRFYLFSGIFIFLFVLSFLIPSLYSLVLFLFIGWMLYLVYDVYKIYVNSIPLTASRQSIYSRLSNGDDNPFQVFIHNLTDIALNISFLEDFPEQFQIRDKVWTFPLPAHQSKFIEYSLRPVTRGIYKFGNLHFLIQRRYGFVQRHFEVEAKKQMACYPSFIRLRQYEFLAIHNRLHEMGIKRIRKIGRSTEFEQIKEYVQGDDIRVINWKATARIRKLMVNHYVDEKSQQVYALIDMGRSMYMPFQGMTLLDYAINATLVFCHIARVKSDKPGVMAFEKDVSFHVPAHNRGDQLYKIQEQLYNAKTSFDESSLYLLYKNIRKNIRQRSLLIMFTNVEYYLTLQRKIKYLQRINKFHRLVVVIFQNTELKKLIESEPESIYDIYKQAIALQFENQKRKIIQELNRHGIITIYTAPENLTVNVINKYLELKARNLF